MNLAKITPATTTNEQKILPVYFPPPVCYSLYAAVRLAILLADPKTHPWFYCNFIQLHFEDLIVNPVLSDHHLNIFPVEYMKGPDYCGAGLFLQERLLDETVLPIDEKSLIPTVIHWIKQGLYVISRIDVSKLPGTRHYQKKPMLHTVFFYGYDSQKSVFKHLDFNKNGDFTAIDVRFEDYQAAFYSAAIPELFREKQLYSQYHITLCSVKSLSKIYFQLDPGCIKTLLTDYLYSINTSNRFNLFVPETQGAYGLSIYPALVDFIGSMNGTEREMDYRIVHVLYEHKALMADRLQYLEGLGIIDSALNLSERFGKIVDLADILRHLVIKYNVTRDQSVVTRIISMLQKIPDQEKPLIEETIGSL